MQILHGQKVSDGIVIGRATIMTSHEVKVKEARVQPSKINTEIRKFRRAVARTEGDIRQLLEAHDESLVDVRQIIETSLHFLNDVFLTGAIEDKIKNEQFTAAYAVSCTIAEMAERLQAIDNPIFSSKVSDMIDLEHRLLNHLVGGGLGQIPKLDRQSIIIADDMTPTQAASLDREKVLAFATERGSWASHTAILARALGIPAVVGVPGVSTAATLGSTIIIDGFEGIVIVDPDAKEIEKYRSLRRRMRRRSITSTQTRNLKAVTLDGEHCRLLGNIETKADVPRVLEFGGDGVGLFRTEFLFLGKSASLSEEQQFEVYREAAIGMEGKPFTIRSIDFGGDKFHGHSQQDREPNPFMGERAIRISLRQPEFFRTQLRAVLRAALHGDVKLMFPMIMDVGEFRRAKKELEKAKEELDERGVEYRRDMPVGVMIELPSAALCAEDFAKEVDFFSIGTNDLTQYTLGVDRTNHRVASLYASHHPAVLRLIRLIAKAAANRNLSVGVCGEMAGDPLCVPLLLGMGINRFSVSAPQIPIVKKKLRSLYLSHCIRLAKQAQRASDADEVLRLIERGV
ncbi:MAG: phosphoenolpyruvate--protein phosphotransferase [Planctomycetota bacterium]